MARVKVFECDVCTESNPVVVWQPPGWRSAIAGVIERPPEEVEHV